MSLDRKTKKRKDKHSVPSQKKTDVIATKCGTGLNKLSGIRCQLNGSVPVSATPHVPINQQSKFHTSNDIDTYKSPSNNNPVDLHSTHSSIVARKPPTPTRHVIDIAQYENDLKQSDLNFSATKPPRPYKSVTLQNGRDNLVSEDGSADLRQNEKVVCLFVDSFEIYLLLLFIEQKQTTQEESFLRKRNRDV